VDAVSRDLSVYRERETGTKTNILQKKIMFQLDNIISL